MGTLVTIYIPTKNREALLRRAVQSVLGQTHADVELIIHQAHGLAGQLQGNL